jgi:hypothetical protein
VRGSVIGRALQHEIASREVKPVVPTIAETRVTVAEPPWPALIRPSRAAPDSRGSSPAMTYFACRAPIIVGSRSPRCVHNVEPVQCDDPRLGKFDPARRAIQSSLARRCHARRPWHANAADKHQARIGCGRRRYCHLGRSDFVLANHVSRVRATQPEVTTPAAAADRSDADHHVGGLDDRGRLHARL